jgi:hypothetical protein
MEASGTIISATGGDFRFELLLVGDDMAIVMSNIGNASIIAYGRYRYTYWQHIDNTRIIYLQRGLSMRDGVRRLAYGYFHDVHK